MRLRISLMLVNLSFTELKSTDMFCNNKGGLGDISVGTSEIDIVKGVSLSKDKSKR